MSDLKLNVFNLNKCTYRNFVFKRPIPQFYEFEITLRGCSTMTLTTGEYFLKEQSAMRIQ